MYSASRKVLRPPDKHGISPSGEHEKTFTGIFLLVHFGYKMTSVCIKLISVCVESTLDVY